MLPRVSIGTQVIPELLLPWSPGHQHVSVNAHQTCFAGQKKTQTDKQTSKQTKKSMPRNGESIGDMSEFTQLKERLSCAPFTSHLDEGQEISFHFPG